MTAYKLVPVEKLKEWEAVINTIALQTAFDIADDIAQYSYAPAVQGEQGVDWKDGYRAAMNEAGWAVRELYVNHVHHTGVDGLLKRCQELEQSFICSAEAAPQPVEQQPISHDWDDQDKCLAILNLSEAARSLGVAQAKDDQDAIGYWRTEVIRFEREARQPTPGVAVMVMVRALERIANMGSMSHHSLESAKITARNALDVLAAHRKQGGDT